ncbi:hypothetical protein BXY66_1548 [Shimia isoporae]|uniref:Uncharacterized protein n=1 Tax=Shimia isoporae TaxID=647720 RepID=A0A4R1NNV0_9RHOB|nr:hypothetical protein [Shimia isoporae]TCL09499.1 hypothetical protein BXY66_1548 [Shimia isoporae]
MADFTLSPATATLIFVVAVLAGHRFRRIWKDEGPRWQLWVTGLLAAVCLLTVALLPLNS